MASITIKLKNETTADVAAMLAKEILTKNGIIGSNEYKVPPDDAWRIKIGNVGTTDDLVYLAMWIREREIALNLQYGTTDDY